MCVLLNHTTDDSNRLPCMFWGDLLERHAVGGNIDAWIYKYMCIYICAVVTLATSMYPTKYLPCNSHSGRYQAHRGKAIIVLTFKVLIVWRRKI